MESILILNVSTRQVLDKMNLSKENQMLLALLAYALFGREVTINAEDIDWNQIIVEADRHVVTAFLYPGVKRLAGVPEGIIHRARSAALLAAAKSDDMLQIQDEVIACLRGEDIPCAVLKGFSVACRYPYPELRVPGDIDLLVGEEKLAAVCAMLEPCGFKRDHETEIHISLEGKGIILELHRCVSVFPENVKGRYACAYMERALRYVERGVIREHAFPVLSLPYQLISLLSHMERHMGSVGIGLRQIYDWAVTVHVHRKEIGEAELALIDRCGLLCFAKVITKMCEKHLNLPPLSWTRDASEEMVDSVLLDIFKAGNFHVHEGTNLISAVMMDPIGENGERSSVVRNYIRYVRRQVKQNRKWAKSAFWIPLFCLYLPIRWFYRVLRGKRKFASISSSIDMAKSREKMLRDLKLFQ